MKLLIVDDSVANVEMLLAVFSRKTDYDVYHAHSATEGFDIYKRERCRIIVADWMMPEVTGLEMVQWIRDEDDGKYAYIIMVTARDSQEDQIMALESGVDDFIRRPFSPRELLARVRIGARIVQTQNALVQSRQALEQAKQEWEATSDAIIQLVCLLDREGRILRANRTLEVWGLDWAADAPGKMLSELFLNVYPGLGQQIAENWPTVQEQVDQGYGYEFVADDFKFGHHFQVHFEPIEREAYTAATAESYAAVSISDITDRRNLELALQEEHNKSQNLLLNILPEPISERLKADERVIADEFGMASVLFTDMVGFTKFAQTVSAAELIALLNDIFSRFDTLTEEFGMEKIKTIGDAYMAAAGVPVARDDHAAAAVSMGLKMFDALAAFNKTNGLNMDLRIGVHSGPLVAGVIGERKFAYDLWGQTVNTASRMESSGVPGAVHISKATAQMLPSKYKLEERGAVELKGIGLVQTYLVRP